MGEHGEGGAYISLLASRPKFLEEHGSHHGQKPFSGRVDGHSPFRGVSNGHGYFRLRAEWWSWVKRLGLTRHAVKLGETVQYYLLSDEASVRKRMMRVRLESRFHCFEYMYVTTKGELWIPER